MVKEEVISPNCALRLVLDLILHAIFRFFVVFKFPLNGHLIGMFYNLIEFHLDTTVEEDATLECLNVSQRLEVDAFIAKPLNSITCL